MRLRTRIASLVAATLVAGSGAALFLSSVPKEEGPPQGELSLPHFWVTTIHDSDFGIREWRYAGDPLTGRGRRSFTTVFLGSHEGPIPLATTPQYLVVFQHGQPEMAQCAGRVVAKWIALSHELSTRLPAAAVMAFAAAGLASIASIAAAALSRLGRDT